MTTLDLHHDVIELLHAKKHLEIGGSGNPFSKAFFIANIFSELKEKRLLWIANSKNESAEVAGTLGLFFSSPVEQYLIDEKNTVTHQAVIRILLALKEKQEGIAIITPEFLFLKVPSIEQLQAELLLIERGEERSTYQLFDLLISKGYKQSEDKHLEPGQYRSVGDVINIFPINNIHPIRVSFFGDTIEEIYSYNQDTGKIVQQCEDFELYPMYFKQTGSMLLEHIPDEMYLVNDEVELKEFDAKGEEVHPEKALQQLKQRAHTLSLTSFPDKEEDFLHLRYLSLLKYYNIADFVNDIKERYIREWSMVLYVKNVEETCETLRENDIEFVKDWTYFFQRRELKKGVVMVVGVEEGESLPRSFQNSEQKIAVITEREIFSAQKKRRPTQDQGAVFNFLASLKPGDYVVHLEHGVGRFVGIDKKTIDSITKEYLQIQYAENDKLFIPTDQADKITKYISSEDRPPKLTRLDSTEWSTINKKVKKEAEKIAKELLQLFAKRELAKGHQYNEDTSDQEKFEATFPYTETPGQLKAINDVKKDMESEKPMDRLVCGDVGFGKTEVALRAAFKAVQNKKQVALISPITILADQHYKTFTKRMKDFGIEVEMLSRFRTQAEQKKIVKKLEDGEVDVIVGTHRLLQPDIKFKDLGLIIVDEEQRFGVKQKEKLKKFRCNVDVLTLSATPIPRTLHMSLNNLRNITTITTPPPGRLPIITEVRKFSDGLIRDAILREKERGGQVYFLHNKVRTIQSITDKLRKLVPEARFVVAHGQMDTKDLESRIFAFKEQKYDVLVSSTIIENGIDLPNANTLIVNNADSFGLSQLYQLRGRVGRGRTQAYSYLLYSSRKLNIDAKKRLRAIVEASELGSGFQIAMRDLEIRGAGEILGSSQHGMMNSVGVSHFIRILNQAVEDLKERGDTSTSLEDTKKDNKETSVELPLTAFIPDWYIPEYEEKISVYQKLSSIKNEDQINEEYETLQEEYGKIPEEVEHLFKVMTLKVLGKKAKLEAVRVYKQPFGLQEANLVMGKGVKPENIFNLLNQNDKWFISGETLKIPLDALGVDWYEKLKKSIIALGTIPEQIKK